MKEIAPCSKAQSVFVFTFKLCPQTRNTLNNLLQPWKEHTADVSKTCMGMSKTTVKIIHLITTEIKVITCLYIYTYTKLSTGNFIMA